MPNTLLQTVCQTILSIIVVSPYYETTYVAGGGVFSIWVFWVNCGRKSQGHLNIVTPQNI